MIKRKRGTDSPPRIRCSLRIAAEDITPEDVSAALGLSADGGMVLREDVAGLSFDVDGTVCSWFVRSHSDSRAPACDHVREILDRLEPRKHALVDLLTERALAEITVAVVGSELFVPIELPPDLMRRVGALNIRLMVYFTPEDKLDTLVPGTRD